jgi:hypothetical protein
MTALQNSGAKNLSFSFGSIEVVVFDFERLGLVRPSVINFTSTLFYFVNQLLKE